MGMSRPNLTLTACCTARRLHSAKGSPSAEGALATIVSRSPTSSASSNVRPSPKRRPRRAEAIPLPSAEPRLNRRDQLITVDRCTPTMEAISAQQRRCCRSRWACRRSSSSDSSDNFRPSSLFMAAL
jgi:hypothetical protein